MNLPNSLTVSRFFLTGGFLYYISLDGVMAKWVALVFFAAGSITDFFDGYLARKYQLISNFGKIMDPIADKFLMLSAFAVFWQMQLVPLWMFVIIAVREIGITLLRFVAMAKGVVLAAEQLGKYKTVAQIVTAFYVLLVIVFDAQYGVAHGWHIGISIWMWISVLLTLISGMVYVRQNAKAFYVI